MEDKVTVRIERLDLRFIQGVLLGKAEAMSAYPQHRQPMARRYFPSVMRRIHRISSDIHEAIAKGGDQ